MREKLICHIPELPNSRPREVIGDLTKLIVAGDGSGMLVYVQDVATGSMIRVGRKYLRKAVDS